ncbi:MAG: DsbA family protein [Chthoniobacterales bacterium]
MSIIITYYLDVVSSWCYWSEPAWAALKQRYEGRVAFQWKIALMDKSGLPTSREQHEWYYRRSGVLMGSPFMLRCDWADFGAAEYLVPNCIAEAGKDFGYSDDRLRLTLASAALREGKKVGEWDIAAEVVGRIMPLGDARSLLEKAKSSDVEKRVRESTEEFHRLQVTQRPTFVLDTNIGDRAVFSGFATADPMEAAIESMLDDADAYAVFGAHFGGPPS